MKKITLIIMILLSIKSFSQNIVPLGTQEVITNYIQTNNLQNSDIYIKDVNHLLDTYLGDWYISTNGKSYRIHVFKDTKMDQFNGNILKRDRLLMNYVVIDNSTNTRIVDKFYNQSLDGLPFGVSYNDKRIVNGQTIQENSYTFYDSGSNANCGNSGYITIKKKSSYELVLVFASSRDIVLEDCPNDKAFLDGDIFILEAKKEAKENSN